MKCPHCGEGELEKVPEDEPWHPDYLICPKCDSTFGIGDKTVTKESTNSNGETQ